MKIVARITLLAAAAVVVLVLAPARAHAQTEPGPYARIGILRPHDGDTTDFEAGYVRHLGWHRQAHDPWMWYGWTVTIGERQRWFVYATFGHSAEALNHPVDPAGDERDTIPNITTHCEFVGNGLYEFLPALSRGQAAPTAALRMELTIVDVVPGSAKAFEEAVAADQASLQGETLWYRMIAGGATPRYLRLRPRANFSAIIEAQQEQPLPGRYKELVSKTTVEVVTFRPTMSYGVEMKE